RKTAEKMTAQQVSGLVLGPRGGNFIRVDLHPGPTAFVNEPLNEIELQTKPVPGAAGMCFYEEAHIKLDPLEPVDWRSSQPSNADTPMKPTSVQIIPMAVIVGALDVPTPSVVCDHLPIDLGYSNTGFSFVAIDPHQFAIDLDLAIRVAGETEP